MNRARPHGQKSELRAFEFYDRETLVSGITFASSVSKARYRIRLAARDAGYSTDFGDIRLRRAPQYDGATFLGKSVRIGATYSPEHLDKMGAR